MTARRKHVHGRKCRLCGRRSSAVSQDTTPNTVDMLGTEEVAGTGFRLRSERPEEEVDRVDIEPGSVGMPQDLRR